MDTAFFERALLHLPKLSTMLRELHPQAADFFKDIYSAPPKTRKLSSMHSTVPSLPP